MMSHDTFLGRVHGALVRQGVAAYIVGGFLRDALLGRPTGDVDLAVRGDAMACGQALAADLGGRCVPLDPERGVARVVVREDSALAHIDVTGFEGDVRDNLACRDFTVNALAVPLEAFLAGGWREAVVDPFDGLGDLRQGLLRMVGPDAFREDPCRLMRAVRLAATLGFHIEEATAQAIRREAHLLPRVAGERLRDEFLALLAAPDIRRWLYAMDDLGLLVQLAPELEEGRGVLQPTEHHWDVLRHSIEAVGAVERLLGRQGEPPEVLEPVLWNADLERHFAQETSDGHRRSTLLRLAALLHDIAKPATRTVEASGRIRFLGHAERGAAMAEAILGRLRLSRRGTDLVRRMIESHLRPSQMAQRERLPTDRAIYRYFRDMGDAAVDTLYLNLADYLAARGPSLGLAGWREHVTIITHVLEMGLYRRPPQRLPRLVDGHDLMREFALAPGPELGRLLEMVREAQGSGRVTTRPQALALVRRHLLRSAVREGDAGVRGARHSSSRRESATH